MRDPKRIARIMDKLESVWYVYPDMRLGQLIANLNPWGNNTDPWHIEDDEWEKAIDEWLDPLAHARSVNGE